MEQFRLGHAPWLPNPGGIIASRAPRASRWIFLSSSCRHRHQRRPLGTPQPSPYHCIPASSLLHGPGPGWCHNRTEVWNCRIERCNRQAGHCLGHGGVHGRGSSLPRRNGKSVSGVAVFSDSQPSKNMTISNYRTASFVLKIPKDRPCLRTKESLPPPGSDEATP